MSPLRLTVGRGQSAVPVLVKQCLFADLPTPVTEFRFHPTRRWKFDLAFLGPAKLAIEIDGGVFLPGGGRHSRGAGYRADCEKFAHAAILGWRVIRCLPEHVSTGQALDWISQALTYSPQEGSDA